MGEALTRLAPCMLMSPLSIAQYLPPEQALFDLVIFDEASQIAPWDAIGSIARGKQVVIAGDPRQMPPTSFFGRSAPGTDDDVEEDMESILDECLAAGIPSHSLSWHYRSRHESLIAFSNHRYYDSNLITFPAAVTRESAVEWRRVQGVYSKGKGRTNQAEAEAIVQEVVRRLTDPKFVAAKRTLAVVTLNSEQQKLVEDLLDRARQRFPQIEPFFAEDLAEPVVVKNLETVQGDERDLIMLGIGYGPTEPGANTMSMNFGPLNRDGGWRRLNVAVTRARQEMLVFTSFEPSMIDLNRTSARAVRDLKHFLEFADRGPRALAEAVRGSVGGFESPFEEAVAQGLARKGWMVVPQIGVSRFRIDLGIVHPDRLGDYLVGVECDGATYHSAATARDRDKVRSAILQGLGWKLLRVWSTEWWVDKEGALERLHAEITALLEQSRNETVDTSLSPDTASVGFESSPDLGAAQEVAIQPSSAEEEGSDVILTRVSHESVFARAVAIPEAEHITYYQVADFSAHENRIDPSRFHETAYDQTLIDLITHTIKLEAPILDTVLVQRVARAHGFQRAGRVIRERVLALVERHHHVRPDLEGNRFVWLDQQAPSEWIYCRLPAPDGPVRQIEEIALEELAAAAKGRPASDLPSEIARLFGVRRLSAPARQRLELALTQAQQEA
jgi:very-short-patch-repair endonuclease